MLFRNMIQTFAFLQIYLVNIFWILKIPICCCCCCCCEIMTGSSQYTVCEKGLRCVGNKFDHTALEVILVILFRHFLNQVHDQLENFIHIAPLIVLLSECGDCDSQELLQNRLHFSCETSAQDRGHYNGDGVSQQLQKNTEHQEQTQVNL